MHRDAFAREPFDNELTYWKQECRNKDGLCTPEKMSAQLVATTRQNKDWIRGVIFTAFQGTDGFPGAVNRAPFPEELNYFMDQALNNSSHRPHYRELREFLKSTHFLDRNALFSHSALAFGSEIFLDKTDIWTAWQFDDPGRVFGPNDFRTTNEEAAMGSMEVIAKYAYDELWLAIPEPHQITRLQELRGSNSNQGFLFSDFVEILKSKQQECVNVDATQEAQYFPLVRQHTRVTGISGSWTVANNNWAYVGPDGHPGDHSSYTRLDANHNLGRLLLSTKNDDGNWHTWVGWNGSYGFASRTEIYAAMNDIPGVYGDNGGSLSVCFE